MVGGARARGVLGAQTEAAVEVRLRQPHPGVGTKRDRDAAVFFVGQEREPVRTRAVVDPCASAVGRRESQPAHPLCGGLCPAVLLAEAAVCVKLEALLPLHRDVAQARNSMTNRGEPASPEGVPGGPGSGLAETSGPKLTIPRSRGRHR